MPPLRPPSLPTDASNTQSDWAPHCLSVRSGGSNNPPYHAVQVADDETEGEVEVSSIKSAQSLLIMTPLESRSVSPSLNSWRCL
jgi:hypothetical protein